jgi:hypothetical protein
MFEYGRHNHFIKGLRKWYSGVHALKGIDLDIEPGQLIGWTRRPQWRRQIDLDQGALRG